MTDASFPVLQFNVTIDDWMAFADHYSTHSSRVRRIMNRQRWIGAVGFTLAFGVWAVWQRSMLYVVIGVLAAAVWTFWWPREFRRVIRSRSRQLYEEERSGDLQGPFRLTIEPDGLRVLTNDTETLVQWHAINAVRTSPGHTFVMLGGSRGYVVPAARVTGGDVAAFVEELRRRVADSGG